MNPRTDLNEVSLGGRLAQDPEFYTLKSGGVKVTLRLATGENRKVDGEWEKVTQYHTVIYFGKDDDDVEPLRALVKGSKVDARGKADLPQLRDRRRKAVCHRGAGPPLRRHPCTRPQDGPDRPAGPIRASSEGPSTFPDDDIPF